MPRFLIVDDHAFIRRGVQAILQGHPEWEMCGEAENGEEALRLAKELHPEVIVMDVSMPRMNGIEATRALRSSEPTVKVILLTLHDSAELARNAFRAGARGYLLKSDAEEELVRAMQVVIGEGTYVSSEMDAEIVKKALSETA